MKMKNPFALRIETDALVGRDRELSEILAVIALHSGHVLMTGDYGTGKTTMLKWLEGMLPDEYTPIYFPAPPEPRKLEERLNGFLFWKPKNPVLLVDEADDLADYQEKALRRAGDHNNAIIILAGTGQLREKLSSDFPALHDRVVSDVRLGIIDQKTAEGMVRNRTACAGGIGKFFSGKEISRLYQQSDGRPRSVLKNCDKELRKNRFFR